MLETLRHHWPEYLMEAAGLGLFMISAGVLTTLLEDPGSPARQVIASEFVRRGLIGSAMGLTAIGLIYSPWGQQSGAHYNPAVTLSFLRLRKVKPWDAFFYIISQFLGGLGGVLLVSAFLRDHFRQAPVSYAVTLPGPGGQWVAFLAETLISFVMMSMILLVSNMKSLTRYTGMFAGMLVFLYITFEAPLSGMSMNPARTFSSAAPAGLWANLWVYFAAPILGMLLAVDAHRLWRGRNSVFCAKLNHQTARRCIFCMSRTLALLLLLGTLALPAQEIPVSLGPIVITVMDLDHSVEFYTQALSFRKESESEARLDSFDRLMGIFGTNVRVATSQHGAERIQL